MDWHFNILTVDKARDRKDGSVRVAGKPSAAVLSSWLAKQHNLATLLKCCYPLRWAPSKGGLSCLFQPDISSTRWMECIFQVWHPPTRTGSCKCQCRLMLFANFQPTVSSSVVVHTLFTHSGPHWRAHDNRVPVTCFRNRETWKIFMTLQVMWGTQRLLSRL